MKAKEGKPLIAFRLSKDKAERLDKILTSLDCTYGGKPSVGSLIKKILRGDIILTKVE